MPKKNNYIVYELKKLEKYWKQLQEYMDDNPPNEAEDRIEYIDLPRGGQGIKVLQTKENIIKLFKETLKELPKLLSDINDLRKQVDTGVEKGTVRGDVERPGFMDDEEDTNDGWKSIPDDDDNIEFEETKKEKPNKKPKSKKQLPPSKSYEAQEEPEEDLENDTDDYEMLDEEHDDPDL